MHRLYLAEWNTYEGFRAHLCEYERLEARHDDPPTKSEIAERMQVHPRTITRAMRSYGLNVREWPPSTWPTEEPHGSRRREKSRYEAPLEVLMREAFALLHERVDAIEERLELLEQRDRP